jgi:hypothetical protein
VRSHSRAPNCPQYFTRHSEARGQTRQKTVDPAMAKFLPGGSKDEDIYKDSDAVLMRFPGIASFKGAI